MFQEIGSSIDHYIQSSNIQTAVKKSG